MNPHFQRALLLFEQGRHELAEQELRQVLAQDPDDPTGHALLALILLHRENFKDATTEAQQAIHLSPDLPFAHYTLARVMHLRHRNEEALAAVHEAIRLDPADADYCALLAGIHFDERRWLAALEAAQRGLQIAPEHVGCTNLLSMALVKLGRRAEAGATIGKALSHDPENSLTHANQGWTYLESGQPKAALEHFRESLRLDPNNEWARHGIVEALKARNFVYALMLKYFLFMARMSRSVQWAIIFGGYFGSRVLAALSQARPEWAPYLLPLRIAYVCFALLTWIANPMFNLMLRLNRFGRLALSREQTVASNWIGACFLLALVALATYFLTHGNQLWLLIAMVFGLLLLPLSGTFNCSEGWPRRSMAIYTIVLATLGLGSLTLLGFAPDLPAGKTSPMEDYAEGGITLFFIGTFLSGLAANALAALRPRR